MDCNKNILQIIVIFIVILYKINADNPCQYKDNCEECLAAHFNCSWCTDADYQLSATERCMLEDDLLKNNCNQPNILFNYQEHKIIANKSVHDYRNEEHRATQIQPQKIKLKLVKGYTQQIKMTYRSAKNSPVDIYYLMDLTWSMKDDKETLVKISEEIANALRSITENYRLGFGSFADKPTMPMAMPGAESNPCRIERETCEPTYGFRHHLPLTNNINDFVKAVNSSKVTGNLDNLEGQLDALMQVIVCSKDIGWNPHSRKIVLLVTDGFMHFAGDGKLAGVTKRNDKQCHLSADGEYTGTLTYDYPSLEEMYRELIKRKVSVIFAVTANVVQTYYEVNDLMKEISAVEILSQDSSNIVDLIKKGHQTFIKKVEFGSKGPSNIKVEFKTTCGGRFDKLKNINFCRNIEIGKEIDFFINITLVDFPEDGNYTPQILIEETSLSENLVVDIDIQKPCPCNENVIDNEKGRQLCSEHGKFQCGMCLCDNGWLGSICNCDSLNYTTNRALEDQCRQKIEHSYNELGSICSNQGECDCGKCHCHQGYIGKYCQCPQCGQCDWEIEECSCGQCVCKYGWSNNKCNCPDSSVDCESPVDASVCSDHGACDCGKCNCNESYFGKFCEISATAGIKYCEYYEPCVRCIISQRVNSIECEDGLDKVCTNNEGIPFKYNFTSQNIDSNQKCSLILPSKDDDEIKCRHFYVYNIDKNALSYLTIHIDKCGPANYAAIGSFMFIITILLGISVIAVFKIVTFYQDKREWAKFESDVNQASFQMESPIYRSPITHYSVPTIEEY